jgi:hypothetical protein
MTSVGCNSVSAISSVSAIRTYIHTEVKVLGATVYVRVTRAQSSKGVDCSPRGVYA